MPPLKDLTGQRFGWLVVIQRVENIGRQTAWLCKCDCGNKKAVSYWNLVSEQTKSCGCMQHEINRETAKILATTHGGSYTRLYTIWIGMKQRCNYKKHKHYEKYGGRGIKVCTEWEHDFAAFREWAMSNGYSEELTIDRIDVDGDYEPSNCRWATYEVQSNNTRSNHYLTFKGETHTVSEWSKILDIPTSTIHNRLKRGKTIEQALKKAP
jgi:hypothetical protein